MLTTKDRSYFLKNMLHGCERDENGYNVCTKYPFKKNKIYKYESCFSRINLNNSLKILINSSYKDVINIIKNDTDPVRSIIKFILPKSNKDKIFILG